MRVFLLDATVWDPVDGSARAVRITDARLKTVWGGVAYEQLLVRPPSISVEAPFDGNFTGGSRTSVDEIELLMPPEFDWLARLDWPETSVRLRMAEDGAADGTLLDYGRFVIARISADERAVRLICKDWQAELTRSFLPQYDGSGGLGGEAADTGQYIPIGWGRLRQAPARFIDRAQLVMRFDRGPVEAVQAVRQRGLLIPIEADHADLAALSAAVITPGQCRTCKALGLVRFRFAPGEPVTVDYLGSSQGGYVETLPSIAGRVAAAAGLSVNAAALASLSAALTQPGGYLASDAATPAQAFDQLLAGVRAVWAIDWNAELTFGRIGFDNPVDIDEVLSVEVSAGRPPSYEHKLGWGRNWRPLADGEVAEGITAADVAGLGALATQDGVDWDSQVGGDGKPQDNATVGAPAGTLVGSIPAEWLHLGASNDIIHEDFTIYSHPSEIEPGVWQRRTGAGEIGLSGSALFSGGRALQCGNDSGDDEVWITTGRSIPYDPDAVYLVTATVFQQSGAGRVYIGVEGRALDGVNLVNRFGMNSSGSQHFCAADNVSPPVGQLVTYTGYLRGYSATPNYSSNIAAPGTVHPDVRRIAPVAILNYDSVPGVAYLDSITVQHLTDGYAETVVHAAEATDRLIKIGSDSLIAQEEKSSFIREVNALLTSADQTIIAANNLGLGAGNPAANWASAVTVRKNSLTNLLASYTTPSLWSDPTGDTTVNPTNLEYALSELNSYIAQAQAAISTRASLTSNWSGVANDTGGKPEDFATNDRGLDTRNDNFAPDYYRQFFPLRVRTEFKSRSVVGAPGTAQFGVLYTLAKWADDSGGPVEQQFTSENGVFYRRGTNTSGWGAWSTSFDTINRPDLSAGHLLNGGSQLAPGQLLNSSIVVNPDGTASFYNGAAWVNLGAVTISGLGYSGDLNATRGAPAGTVVGATAAETVSSRVARLRDNGRALGALLPSGNNAGVTSALLTAPVTGLTASSITISPHTRYIFGSAVYYNGGTISGLSPSTRYHIYADDPDELGGAVVYLATTDISAISGVNRIYFGPVTTAAAGNPGGGGGGGGGDLPPAEFCVDVAMFVDHGLRAGGVRPGDSIWCMDDAGTPVGLRAITDAVDAVADCLRLTASNGAAVIVSCSAPLWTLNRGLIRARDAEPGDVVMTRVCQRDVLSGLTSVDPLGRRRVRKIHVEGISYAAGVDPAALIYTHNPTYKP